MPKAYFSLKFYFFKQNLLKIIYQDFYSRYILDIKIESKEIFPIFFPDFWPTKFFLFLTNNYTFDLKNIKWSSKKKELKRKAKNNFEPRRFFLGKKERIRNLPRLKSSISWLFSCSSFVSSNIFFDYFKIFKRRGSNFSQNRKNKYR